MKDFKGQRSVEVTLKNMECHIDIIRLKMKDFKGQRSDMECHIDITRLKRKDFKGQKDFKSQKDLTMLLIRDMYQGIMHMNMIDFYKSWRKLSWPS